MGTYSVCLIILLICSVSIDSLNNSLRTIKFNLKSTLAFVVFFILFFLSALRQMDLGIDMVAYSIHFDNISSASWIDIFEVSRFEKGFVIFNKLISSFIYRDFRALVILSSFITIASFTFFLYKNSPYFGLSILLFFCLGFYTDSFNLIRQYLAISIVLIGLNSFLNKGNNLLFISFILLASTFHTTSLVFLIIVFLKKQALDLKYLLFILCIITIIILFSDIIILNLINTFYSSYTDKIITQKGFSLLVLQLLILIISFVLIGFHKINQNEKRRLIVHIYILACVLQICSLKFSLFSRVMLYFYILILILIPYSVKSVKDVNFRTLVIGVYTLLAIVFFYCIYLQADSSGILNYILIDF